MYICLIIAILSTFKWVDTMMVDSINAKVNPYQKNDGDKKEDQTNARIRTLCIVVAAIFWAAVIYFW